MNFRCMILVVLVGILGLADGLLLGAKQPVSPPRPHLLANKADEEADLSGEVMAPSGESVFCSIHATQLSPNAVSLLAPSRGSRTPQCLTPGAEKNMLLACQRRSLTAERLSPAVEYRQLFRETERGLTNLETTHNYNVTAIEQEFFASSPSSLIMRAAQQIIWLAKYSSLPQRITPLCSYNYHHNVGTTSWTLDGHVVATDQELHVLIGVLLAYFAYTKRQHGLVLQRLPATMVEPRIVSNDIRELSFEDCPHLISLCGLRLPQLRLLSVTNCASFDTPIVASRFPTLRCLMVAQSQFAGLQGVFPSLIGLQILNCSAVRAGVALVAEQVPALIDLDITCSTIAELQGQFLCLERLRVDWCMELDKELLRTNVPMLKTVHARGASLTTFIGKFSPSVFQS